MENKKDKFKKIYKEYLVLKNKINIDLDTGGMNGKDVLRIREVAKVLFDKYFNELDRGEQHDIRNILGK